MREQPVERHRFVEGQLRLQRVPPRPQRVGAGQLLAVDAEGHDHLVKSLFRAPQNRSVAEMERLETARVHRHARLHGGEQFKALLRAAPLVRETLRPTAQKLRALDAVFVPRHPLVFPEDRLFVDESFRERTAVGELSRIQFKKDLAQGRVGHLRPLGIVDQCTRPLDDRRVRV